MENQLKKSNNSVLAGLILLVIGGVLLLNRMGFPFPNWLFQWPMILVIIGVFDGIRNGFRSPAAIILILIGGFFLLDYIIPSYSLRHYTWPLIIIALGIGLILRPRHGKRYRNQQEGFISNTGTHEPGSYAEPMPEFGQPGYSKEDYVDAVSVFGATRKIIVSKNFRGGDLVCLFGGHEIDLRQADIQGEVVLDVTQIFGGTKLIIPSSWHVKSEMTAFFGGIEDKRQMSQVTVNPQKVLILDGTSIFGGIDIRNY
ncbi:MAG: hypothetical protein INR73_16990 [Williamsia sp.]|nr:hypothetical protein [Williamsia sp.]